MHGTRNKTSLCSASSFGCLNDTARICCWALSPAIDRYLLSAGRSAANPQHAAAAVDRWNRQTDGQTDGRSSFSYTLLRILCGQCQQCFWTTKKTVSNSKSSPSLWSSWSVRSGKRIASSRSLISRVAASPCIYDSTQKSLPRRGPVVMHLTPNSDAWPFAPNTADPGP